MKMPREDFQAKVARAREHRQQEQEWEEAQQALSFEEQYEAYKQRASEVNVFATLDLDALLEREGLELEALDERVRERVATLLADSEATLGGKVDHYPVVEFLYQLHAIAKSGEERLGSMAETVRTWEQFERAYLAEASQREKKAVQVQVQFFVETMLQPRQIVEGQAESTDPYAQRLRTFFPHEWKLIPAEPSRGQRFRFVSKEVIQETIELIRAGYLRPDFTHATGSAALEGIGREGRLRSSWDLQQEGKQVVTGEAGRGQVPYVWGLRSVYADRGGPRFGYQVINWFDEFPVTFGISEERHEAHLAETYPELETRAKTFEPDAPLTRIVDFGGEGMLLGPDVHLASVDVVYCFQRNLDEVRAWVGKHAPHAQVISLEAVDLLGYNGNRVREWALAENLDPVDVWKKVLV